MAHRSVPNAWKPTILRLTLAARAADSARSLRDYRSGRNALHALTHYSRDHAWQTLKSLRQSAVAGCQGERRATMSAAERFATHPPARLEWHPAHERGRSRGSRSLPSARRVRARSRAFPRASSPLFRLAPVVDRAGPDRRARTEREHSERGSCRGRRKQHTQVVADSLANLVRGFAAIRDCGLTALRNEDCYWRSSGGGRSPARGAHAECIRAGRRLCDSAVADERV